MTLDKKQLLKMLKKAGKSVYSNVEGYEKYLKTASEVKIDISTIKNQEHMSKAYDEIIKSKVIDSKFDNVFFNISGAQLPHFLTGEIEKHDCGVHIQPLAYETTKSTIYTILMTEYRIYSKTVMSRSYLMFADITGLHVMPQTDSPSAKAGCVCFNRNPFNNNPQFALAVRERMPCFSLDVGFALPSCKAIAVGCEASMSHVPTAAQLIKVLLAYINLPTNYILRVDNYKAGSIKKKIGHYYVIVDSSQIESIINGNKTSEVKGNKFTDGSEFNKFLENEHKSLGIESFNVKNTVYTILSL